MSALITASGAIIAVIVAAILGFYLGARQNRLERILERRDNAVADVFSAMMRNYRACVSWSAGANPEMQQAVRETYENLLNCYYTSSIWLHVDTHREINAYVHATHDFIIRLDNEMGNSGYLADGTTAKELLAQNLSPALSGAEARLRQELEISSSWWRRLLKREEQAQVDYRRPNA